MTETDSISISQIIDFIYSPQTLYNGTSYDTLMDDTYYEENIIQGKNIHKSIDLQSYSSSKKILQGISIGSAQYGIHGKIDLFDTVTNTLIERKRYAEEVQFSTKIQLYAQYVCLTEMGYTISKLEIRSSKNNKIFQAPLPSEFDLRYLEVLLERIRHVETSVILRESPQSTHSIYQSLSL